MLQTRIPGGCYPDGKTRDGFGFDSKPAGSGVTKTRVLGEFEYQGTRVFDMSPV